MKTSRGLSAALVVVMVSTLLGGCFLLPEADEGPLLTTDSEVQIADDMYAHVAKLNGLDGISARYEPERRSDGSLLYSHGIFIDASNASNADLTWAIVTTWLAFVEPGVASQAVYLEVLADSGELRLNRWEDGGSLLSEDQLTAEVQYWLDFAGIVGGPVYDSLYLGSVGEGYFRDLATMDYLIDFDFDELHNLAEPANGPKDSSFFVCGVGATGALPSVAELTFGAQLQQLKKDAPDGIVVDLQIGRSISDQPYAQVTIGLDMADPQALDSHEHWATVLELVEAISAIPGDQWVGVLHVTPQLGSAEGRSSVTFGQCATELNATDADLALFDLIGDAKLPEGSEAGACVRP